MTIIFDEHKKELFNNFFFNFSSIGIRYLTKKITLFNKQLKIQGHVCCELFNLTCVNIPDTQVHNVPVNAT